MFDKDLFYDLCRKYKVATSSSAKTPMLKGKGGIRAVTGKDVLAVFGKNAARKD